MLAALQKDASALQKDACSLAERCAGFSLDWSKCKDNQRVYAYLHDCVNNERNLNATCSSRCQYRPGSGIDYTCATTFWVQLHTLPTIGIASCGNVTTALSVSQLSTYGKESYVLRCRHVQISIAITERHNLGRWTNISDMHACRPTILTLKTCPGLAHEIRRTVASLGALHDWQSICLISSGGLSIAESIQL